MQRLVKRPPVTVEPGRGLFRNDHFQMAWVTNDIDRACTIFKARYGIKEFARLVGPMPSGGQIHVELAWAGGLMYELLHVRGPGLEHFTSVLPPNGFAIRPHHLGYFVNSAAEWQALHEEIERGGWKIVHRNSTPGFLSAYIIEVPEMGHYLEYIYPEAGGIAFFESVPRS
jgi:hypothetical protein